MTKPFGKYFSFRETICRDGKECPPELYGNLRLSLDLADKVREIHGQPLLAVSWYRSPEWNKHLIENDIAKGVHGVASGSEHMKALAVDLRPIDNDVIGLHRAVMHRWSQGSLPELGGIGLYPKSGWVHVDAFHVGHLRTWTGY